MSGLLQLLFPALVVLFVSACGGGGSAGGLPGGGMDAQCAGDQTRNASGECVQDCAQFGLEPNPFQPSACRAVFRCPVDGQREVADQVCACPQGQEQSGNACQPTQGAPNFALEYERSMGLSLIGHQVAERMGLTGAGVTVGFLDSGHLTYLNTVTGEIVKHPDLPSIRALHNAPPRFRYPPYQDVVTPGEFSAESHHAIWVAGVMAAQINGEGIRGIAPGASYLYNHFAGIDFLGRGTSGKMTAMIALGAHVINNSYGNFLDENHMHNLRNLEGAERREYYLRHIMRPKEYSDLLQADTHPADRAIIVYGAGNEDGTSTREGAYASRPYYLPELRGHFLAVAALGENVYPSPEYVHSGTRCGAGSASYCLTAPANAGYMLGNGELIKMNGAGTSFSAPLVSGALAVMEEYFNRMGGIGSDDLVRRILETANKSGVYADESIYGAGLLDLGSALSPVGALRLRSGESVWDGGGVLLSESEFFSGLALGDSAGRALRGMTLAAFDDLHAPFPISSEMVLRESSRARLDGLGSHLRRWQVGDVGSGSFSFSAFRDGSAWWSLNAPGDSHFDWDERVGSGEEDSPAVFSDWVGNPYSDLAGRGLVAGSSFRLSGGGGFRMAMFGESLGNEKRFRGVLAEFSFSPFADGSGEGEGSRWFAQAGGIREYSGLLASSGSGLFSDLNSRTAFAGLGFAGGFSDGWRYRLGAHWGRTSAEGAWLSATDSLRSGSYAAGLERSDVWRSGDGLGFRIRQPLRVSGGLRFRIPTGRTKYGELTWSEVSGTPSGRELEWEARYRRPYEGGHWGVSAVLVSESGHRSGAKTEGRALFAFERDF